MIKYSENKLKHCKRMHWVVICISVETIVD